MSGELRAVTSSGRSVYAHIMNAAGQRWNGSAFETFSTSNYSTYGITVTEQGATGVYIGNFPTGLSAGNYEVFHYAIIDTTATNGDPVVSTQSVVWDGSATVTAGSSIDSLTGAEVYNYVIRTFKRTDKSTEVYESIADTINDMMKRYAFDEVSEQTGTTDSISSLGQYQIDVETDLGLFVGDVVLLEEDTSSVLRKLSKQEYDTKFPNPAADNIRSRPRYWCFYGGQIWLGPVPDSISYTYKLNQSQRLTTEITAAVDPVPFSGGKKRETLKFGTLARLYAIVEAFDKAQFWSKAYEDNLQIDIAAERVNRRATTFVEPDNYGVY